MTSLSRIAEVVTGVGACVLALAACSRSVSGAAIATPLPEAAETSPAPTPDASSALPTATAPCLNSARFLADLTIPDGTVVAAGETIDKRWSVENDGTCDWGPGYRLVQVAGEGLIGPEEVALFPARAGASAVWQVVLQAPEAPGEYMSQWQARAPDGTLFGDLVYLIVVVGTPPAP